MATTIGEAVIPVRATLDKLDDDLKGARSKIDGALGGISRGIQGLGKLALGGVLTGITAVAGGFAFAAKTAIDMNSTLETSTLQFETLMGDADRAREHVEFLFEFAKKTPFETGPIIEASKMLQTFGGDALNTQGNLLMIGDAAAATNAPINELGFWTGRLFSQLQAGKPFGEAAARLQELAVISPEARAAMEELQKSGASADEVWAAFSEDLGRFSGAMEKQAGTWKGLTSTISDAVNLTIAKALKPFFELAKQGMEGLVTWLSSPEVEAAIETLTGFLEQLVGNIVNLISTIADAGIGSLEFKEALGLLVGEETAAWITDLITKVQSFAQTVIDFLTPIWEAITQFVSWKDVLMALGIAIAYVVLPAIGSLIAPILGIIITAVQLIGYIALLRSAWENDWGGIRTTLINLWENVLMPAFIQIKEWLSVNIPKAIDILSDFWTNTLQPAIQAVFNWLDTVLMPFIQGTVVPWLQEHIPAAIQILSDFWTNILWPAIQAVWSWISGTLIPFFQNTVVPWLQEKIPAAIQTLSDFWNNTLLPAITDVWDFINTYLIPIWTTIAGILAKLGEITITALAGFWQNILLPALQDVYDFLDTYLTPAFTWLKDNVIEPLGTAIINLRDRALTWFLNKLQDIKDFFDNFKLPDWLQLGSPTPLELGLMGINKAMANLDRTMSQSMLFNPGRLNVGGIFPVMELAGAEIAGSDTRPNYSSTTTIYTNRDPMRVLRASRHLDRLGDMG